MPTNFMSIILILGLKASLELNLISRLYSLNLKSKTATSEEILDSYSDVFEGLGCLPTEEYKIRLDKLIINPPRKNPYALKNKVKNELYRLEKMNVIKKKSQNL